MKKIKISELPLYDGSLNGLQTIATDAGNQSVRVPLSWLFDSSAQATANSAQTAAAAAQSAADAAQSTADAALAAANDAADVLSIPDDDITELWGLAASATAPASATVGVISNEEITAMF